MQPPRCADDERASSGADHFIGNSDNWFDALLGAGHAAAHLVYETLQRASTRPC